jgi:hypothetical protein
MKMDEESKEGVQAQSEAARGERPERADESLETVGTGSMLGIGCLIVVVVLVLLAIASRWFGVTW